MFSSLQTALNWFILFFFLCLTEDRRDFLFLRPVGFASTKTSSSLHTGTPVDEYCTAELCRRTTTESSLEREKKIRLTRGKAGTNRSGGGRLQKPGGLQDWKDQKERGKNTVFNESSSVESRARTGNDFWKCTCKHTIKAHSNCAHEVRNFKNDTPKEGAWDVVFVSEKWKE